jgi:hypothetical protein
MVVGRSIYMEEEWEMKYADFFIATIFVFNAPLLSLSLSLSPPPPPPRQYLHYGTYIAPPGFLMCFFGRNDGKYFLICYAIIAYYFSNRMVRLIIIMGPITSALGGVFLANVFDWVVYQFVDINDDGSNDVVPVAAVVDKVRPLFPCEISTLTHLRLCVCIYIYIMQPGGRRRREKGGQKRKEKQIREKKRR